MFKLIIEYNNGCIEEHIFNTKEEVENEVAFKWTEEATFSVGVVDPEISFLVFWEDRFDFGW